MSQRPDAHLLSLARRARTLLLDFDGPLCDLFATLTAGEVADRVRRYATELRGDLNGVRTLDPLELLRTAYTRSADFGREIEEFVTEQEIAAARTAAMTPGAEDVIDRAGQSGRAVLVVSNNSESAIRTYLDRAGLAAAFSAVVARPFGRPEQMKPNSFLVSTALSLSRGSSTDALFVGDSTTDVIAAHGANVSCLGYAKGSPDRAETLTESGADAVILDMRELAPLLEHR